MAYFASAAFITNKYLVSTSFTVSSHWSLEPVGSRVRGIDGSKKCIIETDGTVVRDISSRSIPRVFEFLDDDVNNMRLWLVGN